jgi:transposase
MNERSEPPAELSIPAEDWEQAPASMRVVILALWQQVQEIGKLRAKIAELEEQLNRNSRNSSQPPSSDRPDQGEPKSEEQKTRRKRGGQPGHKGHQRQLMAVEEVDEMIECKPTHCKGCGAELEGGDPEPYRYQQVELPPVKPHVTEYQVSSLTCPCCGEVNKGELSPEVAASMFGPNLTALIVILMGVFRLSKRKVMLLLKECFGVDISPGSVVNLQNAASEALAEPVEEAHAYVEAQPARNIDETGWKQGDQDKKAWLWVVVTPLVTVFEIALSRAGQVAKDLLGENSDGAVGSDRYSAYTWLNNRKWQVCWSHLLRDFQKILERGGNSYIIGENLRLQGEYVLMMWARVRDGTLSHEDFLAELPAIQKAVRHWLTEGIGCDHAKTAKTCRNILQLDPALWTFAYHEHIEPTNNSAERALRHAVIWRRISSGTQSASGSRFVERILTAVETCRQQGTNPLDFVRRAIIAHRSGQSAPSLLPASLSNDCGIQFVTP